MSEKKKKGRPTKRPVTVAEWLKSDEIPNQMEIIAMLKSVQEKRLRELHRLDMNHQLARTQMRQQYNLLTGFKPGSPKYEATLQNLELSVQKGDNRALQRIKELESGSNAFHKLLEKQQEARDNIKELFRKEREKILTIDRRFKDQLKQYQEARVASSRASQEYVEVLEHRIFLMEKVVPDMKKVNLLIAKIEYAHSKVKELEDENFKIKRALASQKILVTDR